MPNTKTVESHGNALDMFIFGCAFCGFYAKDKIQLNMACLGLIYLVRCHVQVALLLRVSRIC